MSERPDWLKVVGGKEHVPDDKKPAGEIGDAELYDIYRERKDNRPVDLEEKASKRLVEEVAPGIRRWSKAELHAYLSNDGLWEKPSQTLAVLEEIRNRMLDGSLDPRE